MVGHAYDGLPDEACGLLGGDPGSGAVEVFVPTRNADASSRTFSLGPDAWRLVDDEIEGRGLQIVGVVHSHTHTEAYPSPTDVAQAANPMLAGWRWVIVSLRDEAPVVRSFRIDGDAVTEERIQVIAR
jgi:[CysO sulfur-carrier protein]-S-L-cysteine hydrolase